MSSLGESPEKLPFTYRIINRREKNSAGAEVDFDEIVLSGKLEFLANPDLEKNFCDMPEVGSDRLVLNLKEINFINSLGLNFILNEYDKCTKRGKKFYLAGVGNYVKKVFSITKLDSLLKTIPEAAACVDM